MQRSPPGGSGRERRVAEFAGWSLAMGSGCLWKEKIIKSVTDELKLRHFLIYILQFKLDFHAIEKIERTNVM